MQIGAKSSEVGEQQKGTERERESVWGLRTGSGSWLANWWAKNHTSRRGKNLRNQFEHKEQAKELPSCLAVLWIGLLLLLVLRLFRQAQTVPRAQAAV